MPQLVNSSIVSSSASQPKSRASLLATETTSARAALNTLAYSGSRRVQCPAGIVCQSGQLPRCEYVALTLQEPEVDGVAASGWISSANWSTGCSRGATSPPARRVRRP